MFLHLCNDLGVRQVVRRLNSAYTFGQAVGEPQTSFQFGPRLSRFENENCFRRANFLDYLVVVPLQFVAVPFNMLFLSST